MRIQSKAIPLHIDNIDTDQIIPAQFLKQINKKGYGKHLFYHWRYIKDYIENPDFELNRSIRRGSKILISGNNFGCGSSREHAAWAIADYGFKAVISSKFADIFKSNAYNNGILPIELESKSVGLLSDYITKNPDAEISIDLDSQSVDLKEIEFSETFEISPLKKSCFMEGTDETQYLINLRKEIEIYENQQVNQNNHE